MRVFASVVLALLLVPPASEAQITLPDNTPLSELLIRVYVEEVRANIDTSAEARDIRATGS